MTPAELVATARQIKMTARAAILVSRGGTGAARGAATTAVAAGMGALKTALQQMAAQKTVPLSGYSEAELQTLAESLMEAKVRPFREGIRDKLNEMTSLYAAIVDLAGLV